MERKAKAKALESLETSVVPEKIEQVDVQKEAPQKEVSVEQPKNLDQEIANEHERMKRYFESQPKMDFYIPLDNHEKLGQAYIPVVINGYRFEIKKGYAVKVPLPVYELLIQHLNIQDSNQLRNFAHGKRIDEIDDPKALAALT